MLLADWGWRLGVKPKEYCHNSNDGAWIMKKVYGLNQVSYKQEEGLNAKMYYFAK
jgi:hypothetical protein